MKTPLIVFDNFTFKYDAQVEPTLHDINLTLYEGEKVLILGQSGSGKSTMVHCLNGLIPYSFKGKIQGSLTIAGVDTLHTSIFQLSKLVGTVLQDSDAQFVALSVEDDVAFALENKSMPKKEMIPLVHYALNKVGMIDFLKQVPFELSGGQKQKVAVAGILHEDVKILLFDEPLASLDPVSNLRTVEMMDEMAQDGKTVIVVEHRFEDILHRKVDRVIVLEEGRVVFDGDVNRLLQEDILRKNGLREPLYVQALRMAKIDLKGLSLNQVQDVDFAHFKKQLSFLNDKQPIHEVKERLPLVEVKNVSFAYDPKKPVLKDISFRLYQGERLALVGQNGAGKSTLAKLLVGVIRPQSGSIEINGEDIKIYSIAEIANRIGYVMQNPNTMIVKHMIKDEVSLALTLRKYSPEDIEKAVTEALTITGLESMSHWPINALSYGQKKRLTVASILALKPEVLILDEPTAGQDYRHYTEIMDFLNEINVSAGISFIFITHDIHLAIEYTDRALVFSSGTLIKDARIFDALSDQSILERASLTQTSLYTLAQKCGFEPERVIENFILHKGLYE
jgi:energy-coupling factor transport system ATP-binding protein